MNTEESMVEITTQIALLIKAQEESAKTVNELSEAVAELAKLHAVNEEARKHEGKAAQRLNEEIKELKNEFKEVRKEIKEIDKQQREDGKAVLRNSIIVNGVVFVATVAVSSLFWIWRTSIGGP